MGIVGCIRLEPTGGEMCRAPESSINHALTSGDTVVVFAITAGGPSIEGIGVIHSHAALGNHYWIQFSGEPIAKLRFINPDWQTTPERSLELLRAFWQSQNRGFPIVEDFFPDSAM